MDTPSLDDTGTILHEVKEAPEPQPRRRARRWRKRSRTLAIKRITRAQLAIGRLENPPHEDAAHPTTRGECADGPRPCPLVGCKHHLYLDVNPETGSIKLNFPDLEPWELRDSCALDVAERGGITLEEVGEIMNLTRERIRQVEVRGLLKLKMAKAMQEVLPAPEVEPVPVISTIRERLATALRAYAEPQTAETLIAHAMVGERGMRAQPTTVYQGRLDAMVRGRVVDIVPGDPPRYRLSGWISRAPAPVGTRERFDSPTFRVMRTLQRAARAMLLLVKRGELVRLAEPLRYAVPGAEG